MTEQIGTSNLLRTWANNGTVVVPASTKIDEGWLRGEQPPHEWMNYIHNVLGQKLNHVLSRGAADWNSTTLYLVGSLVRHDGRVWISFVENSNSEPGSGNANWSALQDERNSIVTEPVSVTVGSGPSADFESVVAACEELSRLRPGFKNNEFAAEIVIQSGEALEEQVIVRGTDLSWITLKAEDPLVTIVRSALSIDIGGSNFPALAALDGGGLPRVECRFEMDTSGVASDRHGVFLARTGVAFVMGGGNVGVRNAGGDGIVLNAGSTARVNNADFSGAGGSGASLAIGGTLLALNADFSGANGGYGVFAQRFSRAFLESANCRKGETDDSDDIRVNGGSLIEATSATGGTNITPNEVTNNGIIFK